MENVKKLGSNEIISVSSSRNSLLTETDARREATNAKVFIVGFQRQKVGQKWATGKQKKLFVVT